MVQFNKEVICTIVRQELQQFPLFNPEHSVDAALFLPPHSDGYWVGYESLPITTDLYHKITCFDLNIMGNCCTLDFIAVDSEHQGKGYGRQLYGIIERIAKSLGCTSVRMIPFGSMKGKTRREYMHELGYKDIEGLWVENFF